MISELLTVLSDDQLAAIVQQTIIYNVYSIQPSQRQFLKSLNASPQKRMQFCSFDS